MVIFHSYVKLPEGISHMIWMYLTLTTWNAEFLGQGNRANQLPALSKSQNEHGFFPGDSSNRSLQILYWYQFLVGGLEHDFYDFPFSWEFHHPDWRTHIFQRGRYTTRFESSAFPMSLFSQVFKPRLVPRWGILRGGLCPLATRYPILRVSLSPHQVFLYWEVWGSHISPFSTETISGMLTQIMGQFLMAISSWNVPLDFPTLSLDISGLSAEVPMLARLMLSSPLRQQLKGIAVGDGCTCGSVNGAQCLETGWGWGWLGWGTASYRVTLMCMYTYTCIYTYIHIYGIDWPYPLKWLSTC